MKKLEQKLTEITETVIKRACDHHTSHIDANKPRLAFMLNDEYPIWLDRLHNGSGAPAIDAISPTIYEALCDKYRRALSNTTEWPGSTYTLLERNTTSSKGLKTITNPDLLRTTIKDYVEECKLFGIKIYACMDAFFMGNEKTNWIPKPVKGLKKLINDEDLFNDFLFIANYQQNYHIDILKEFTLDEKKYHSNLLFALASNFNLVNEPNTSILYNEVQGLL